MEIKAIDTRYNGHRFRSRTEARWAVFFDELGIKWFYEHQGYSLENGVPYLPDFFFPEHNAFAEVKGVDFSDDELEKCRQLSGLGGMVFLLPGPPAAKSYKFYQCGNEGCEIIFMPRGNKYFPFYCCYDFDEKYCDRTKQAIDKANSMRFEFNG